MKRIAPYLVLLGVAASGCAMPIPTPTPAPPVVAAPPRVIRLPDRVAAPVVDPGSGVRTVAPPSAPGQVASVPTSTSVATAALPVPTRPVANATATTAPAPLPTQSSSPSSTAIPSPQAPTAAAALAPSTSAPTVPAAANQASPAIPAPVVTATTLVAGATVTAPIATRTAALTPTLPPSPAATLIAVSTATPSRTPQPTATSAAVPSATPTFAPSAVGQRLTSGTVALTVHSVSRSDAGAGRALLVAEVSIENLSGQSMVYAPAYFRALDSTNGQVFGGASGTTLPAGVGGPGVLARAKVAFDVPAAARGLAISYEPPPALVAGYTPIKVPLGE